MAPYSASDFTGFCDSYAVPAGSSDVIFVGSVDLILSTGITQQVFDTLSAALQCFYSMEQQKLYSLSPNEDVTVINLRPKPLISENVYINQEMMSSCVLTYHGNQVQAIHRSMADMISLSEALASVGFKCIGLSWVTGANPKMETGRADKDRPRIQVVDYVYESPTLLHTNLQDSSPIIQVSNYSETNDISIIIFFLISISILMLWFSHSGLELFSIKHVPFGHNSLSLFLLNSRLVHR